VPQVIKHIVKNIFESFMKVKVYRNSYHFGKYPHRNQKTDVALHVTGVEVTCISA